MFGSKQVDIDLDDAKEGRRGSVDSQNRSIVGKLSKHIQENENRNSIKLMTDK
jgi:hypothetical protein